MSPETSTGRSDLDGYGAAIFEVAKAESQLERLPGEGDFGGWDGRFGLFEHVQDMVAEVQQKLALAMTVVVAEELVVLVAGAEQDLAEEGFAARDKLRVMTVQKDAGEGEVVGNEVFPAGVMAGQAGIDHFGAGENRHG